MKKSKVLLIVIMMLIMGCVVSLATACKDDTLVATFDAGEYGTITSNDATQEVDDSQKLKEPTIAANNGYIFVGFNPKIEDIAPGKKGNITIKAEYVKMELILIDPATNQPITDDFKTEMPSYGMGENGIRTPSPKVTLRLTDMSNSYTEDFVDCLEPGGSLHPNNEYTQKYTHIMSKLAVEVSENEYVETASGMFNAKWGGGFDWEADVVLDLKYTPERNGESRIITSVGFAAFRSHIHMTEIHVYRRGIIDSNGVFDEQQKDQPDYPANAEDLVVFSCEFFYEDGSFNSVQTVEFVITRIWSVNEDEIDAANFDDYATYIGDEDGIQLTDKVGNGWNVEFYVYYAKDNVRSNTITIGIS